ncbi:hypothetical protein [Jiangella alba]|uniref:hypothetical protein n=1 Tax=Jiangella alba TaxID=561176 RepID=UPI00083EC2B4|nr:hypothetical protein [Jiangella alba]
MELDALIAAQCGVVSRAQALPAGFTVAKIKWLVGAGRWHRLHAHTFATFTGPLPFEAQVWAAVLRAGRRAAASHRAG